MDDGDRLDYFAGQALVGILGNDDMFDQIKVDSTSLNMTYAAVLATASYEIAEAMMQERDTLRKEIDGR
jgi:hypothetical protein